MNYPLVAKNSKDDKLYVFVDEHKCFSITDIDTPINTKSIILDVIHAPKWSVIKDHTLYQNHIDSLKFWKSLL